MICCLVKAVTENSLCRKGTNKTRPSSRTPAANAAMLYQFEENLVLKMLCLLRQLKPWNNRASVRVENAIVLARASVWVRSPRWKAIMVQTAISPP